MSRKIEFKWGNKVYEEVIEGNIQLGEMVPDQIIKALNIAVGNFAFYGSLRADAKKMAHQIDTESDMWMAQKMSEIAKNPDYKSLSTEKAKIQQAMLDNAKEWMDWEQKKRAVALVTDKLYVLVQSYELMTKTLQSALSYRRQELGNIHQSAAPMATGVGDLMDDDFDFGGESSHKRLHKDKE